MKKTLNVKKAMPKQDNNKNVKIPKADLDRWDRGGEGVIAASKPYVAKGKKGK